MGHWSEATRGYSRHTIGRKVRTLTDTNKRSVRRARCWIGSTADDYPEVGWDLVDILSCEGSARRELANLRAEMVGEAMKDPVQAYRIIRDHMIVSGLDRGVRMSWREASIAALIPFAARLFHREGRELYRLTRDTDGRILRRIWADVQGSNATARLISLEAVGAAREAVDASGEARGSDFLGGVTDEIADLIRMVTE